MGNKSFNLIQGMKNINTNTKHFQTTGDSENRPAVKSKIREKSFLVVECFNQKYTRLARN